MSLYKIEGPKMKYEVFNYVKFPFVLEKIFKCYCLNSDCNSINLIFEGN